MSPSAHTALVVSIAASAVGALVMCLLVARYGLVSSSEEDRGRALLVTRFGHALAGVCFAATGILAVVALISPTREPRAAPTTVVKLEPDRAAEARLQALATDVKALAERIDQAEARMTMTDTAARRLGDEVGSIDARARQLERTVAALPRRAIVSEPAPKETKPAPVPPPAASTPATTPAPAEVPVATPPPSPGPIPEPVVAPRPRASEPVVHRAPPPPARVAEPAASPRVPAPSGRTTVEAPPRAAGGAAAAKADDQNLTDKVRDDWKTIRGGFATAGDDLKAAVRDLSKKLWR